ncbi:hypothetical protein FGB62_16g142 [Gracilaria domingensis]|nr:hypothetical protein FGB62_16g142 [Gracilaria domingensis]
MARRNHLGKVDDIDVSIVVNKHVELVEVTVNQAVLRKPDCKLYESVCDLFRLGHLVDVGEQGAGTQLHDDDVARLAQRPGHWEVPGVQGAHKGVFLDGSQPGKVDPTGGLAVDQVVPLALDCAEGGAPQAVQLHGQMRGVRQLRVLVHERLRGRDDKHVGLLADAQRAAHGVDDAALDQRVEREVVVAHGGEPVAGVGLALAVQQLVLVDVLERAHVAAVLEAGDGGNERDGHDLVVAHAHLHGGERAEVIVGEVAQRGRIELHGGGRRAAAGGGGSGDGDGGGSDDGGRRGMRWVCV